MPTPAWQAYRAPGQRARDLQESQTQIPWLVDAPREELARIVDALHRCHTIIAAMPELDKLLPRILEESRFVARAEASSLMLFDAATQELYFHVALNEKGDQAGLKSVRLKLGQGIAGTAAESRETVLVNDVQSDPRFYRGADAATQYHTRNLLAVPMIDRDNLIGVVEVLNKLDGEPFTTMDMHVLEMFSSLAATSVANARLIEEQMRNERLAAIGHAVTSLSHHTKNIVSGLSSSAELIEMGLNAGNVELLKKSWAVFKRSTSRISHFVQDMLSFSKPRQPLREPARIGEIIEDARQNFAELFVQRNIAVAISVEGLDDPAYLDTGGLFRAFLNLMTNAADAAPEVGGAIRVSAWRDGDWIEMEFADNGPGVAAENKGKIFDTFFSTKGSKGTGIGLAVTQKAIQEHGGTITVEDAPGGGALFRVRLPFVAPPQRSAGQVGQE